MPPAKAFRSRRSQAARRAIGEAGGLVNMSQIAARIGCAKSEVTRQAKLATFPEPVFRSDKYAIYLWDDVAVFFRDHYRPRRGALAP